MIQPSATVAETVLAANEATAAETARITARMTEQCQRVTELGREFVALLSVDPSSLSPDECGTQAYLLENKHREIATAVNELAQQPVVTVAWAAIYLKLCSAGAPFQNRYSEWREHQKEEQERQERAAAYREQCHNAQQQHEQRLRGEIA